MKIELIQSGGYIAMEKKAKIDVDWDIVEINEFISAIKQTEEESKARDSINYTLEINNTNININPKDVPDKYKEVFATLMRNLKIVPH